MIVLDTNVVSEPLRPSPATAAMDWLAAQDPERVFVTAITQAEILYGIEILPRGKRRTLLQAAVERVFGEEFEGRILPFDEMAAPVFANLTARRAAMGRPISQFDASIAAICLTQGFRLATRNVADFADCGIALVNPWQP